MSYEKPKVVFEAVTRIPAQRGYSQEILDTFLEQEHPIVKITMETRTTKQLYGVLSQATREQSKYVGKIKVSRRGEDLYIEKIQSSN